MIVDDSATMRRCVLDCLPASGVFIECSDGQAAVRAFAMHRPDWILMDIEMSGMDGLTAARLIKADWPEARIIFVTSHDHPRFREASERLGAVGYVLKDNLEQIGVLMDQAGGAVSRQKF